MPRRQAIQSRCYTNTCLKLMRDGIDKCIYIQYFVQLIKLQNNFSSTNDIRSLLLDDFVKENLIKADCLCNTHLKYYKNYK